jgi:hypothetical protein
MKLNIVIAFFFINVTLCLCQYSHEPVFPSLKGQELFIEVQSSYKPDSIIDYAYARDTLFLKIDAINRNLSCIYTGLTLNIPEGIDPTQAVFLNGVANGINTEHPYPLSLGTDNTPAKSDMHHIYPSRIKTNADRGNLPFAEVNDDATKRWYFEDTESSSKPSSNIDAYSELGDGFFEPRESVKGDIARSMFYIFTIYNNEVTSVNNTYFESQKKVLCDWHFKDVVDEKEWTRTKKIKKYQGNENPFVLDCSLAARLYCDQQDNACKLLYNEDERIQSYMEYDYNTSLIKVKESQEAKINIYTTAGVLLFTTIIDSNEFSLSISEKIEMISSPQLLMIELERSGHREILKILR